MKFRTSVEALLFLFVLLLLIVAPALGQSQNFVKTYTFPGTTLNVACCSTFSYGFTPVSFDPSVTGENVNITSISVSAVGSINSPDLIGDAGLDWEVFIGPQTFGLPVGEITGTTVNPGGYSSSAPTQLRFAEIDQLGSGSATFSGTYSFGTGGGLTTNAQITNFKAASTTPMNVSQGLYVQVFIWNGAPGANIDFSGILSR